MTFVPIPDSEMPSVLSAVKDGRCIVCYKSFAGEGCYCPDCDEVEETADLWFLTFHVPAATCLEGNRGCCIVPGPTFSDAVGNAKDAGCFPEGYASGFPAFPYTAPKWIGRLLTDDELREWGTEVESWPPEEES